MNIYHNIAYIETPHCRCISQVKSTVVNQILNTFYYGGTLFIWTPNIRTLGQPNASKLTGDYLGQNERFSADTERKV